MKLRDPGSAVFCAKNKSRTATSGPRIFESVSSSDERKGTEAALYERSYDGKRAVFHLGSPIRIFQFDAENTPTDGISADLCPTFCDPSVGITCDAGQEPITVLLCRPHVEQANPGFVPWNRLFHFGALAYARRSHFGLMRSKYSTGGHIRRSIPTARVSRLKAPGNVTTPLPHFEGG